MSVLQAKNFSNLKTHHKMMLGALGALTPSLLNLYASDIEMMLLAPPSIAYVFGYGIRVLILVLYGSLIAFFHQDEQSPMKLFQLGAAAPALITIMLGMGKHGDPAARMPEAASIVNEASTSLIWAKKTSGKMNQLALAEDWDIQTVSMTTTSVSGSSFDRIMPENGVKMGLSESMPPATNEESNIALSEAEALENTQSIIAQNTSNIEVEDFDLTTETDFFKQFWLGFIGGDTKHKNYVVVLEQYQDLGDAKAVVKTLRQQYRSDFTINLYQLPNQEDAYVIVLGAQSSQLTALQLANKAEGLGLEGLDVVLLKKWLTQQNRKRAAEGLDINS